jgi:hypothetical protein
MMLLHIEHVALANENQLEKYHQNHTKTKKEDPYIPTIPVIKHPTVGVSACK